MPQYRYKNQHTMAHTVGLCYSTLHTHSERETEKGHEKKSCRQGGPNRLTSSSGCSARQPWWHKLSGFPSAFVDLSKFSQEIRSSLKEFVQTSPSSTSVSNKPRDGSSFKSNTDNNSSKNSKNSNDM